MIWGWEVFSESRKFHYLICASTQGANSYETILYINHKLVVNGMYLT